MDRTDLIKFLMIFRMSRAGLAAGLPEDLAIAQAEEVVRQQVTSEMAALSTPDGSIVVMVETFLRHVGPIVKGVFDLDNPPGGTTFKMANVEAISKIEAHRAKMFGSEGVPPRHFPAYVYYRTRLEIRKKFQISSDQMGLDEHTVHQMVRYCVAMLAPGYAQDASMASEHRFVSDSAIKEPRNSFNFTAAELSVYGFHQLDVLREALLKGDSDELYAIRNAIGRKIGRITGVDDERPFLEAYYEQLQEYLNADHPPPVKTAVGGDRSAIGFPSWAGWGLGSFLFLVFMMGIMSPASDVSSNEVVHGLSQSEAENAATAAMGGGLFALLALAVLYYFIRGFETPSRARKYAAWASLTSGPFWMVIGNEAILGQPNQAVIGRLVGFGFLATIFVAGAYMAGMFLSYFEKTEKKL